MSGLIDSISGMASPWLYVVVALIAAAEAALLIGLVFPGEAALLVGGVAASRGQVNLVVMVVVAVVAAIAGDTLGYWVGRHFGERIRTSRVGRAIGVDRWASAEQSLRTRGGPAVALGRWVSVMRALIPGVAGMSAMGYRNFLVWNVLGALTWAPTMVIVGYLAGNSYRVIEKWLGRAGMLIAVAVVVGLVIWRSISSRRQRGAGADETPSQSMIARDRSSGHERNGPPPASGTSP